MCEVQQYPEETQMRPTCSISLLCIHKRISCVCTRDLLCMHNTLAGARDPKKARSRARDQPSAFFGSLARGVPGPQHAQECCACTGDLLCIHKRFFCVCETMRNYAKLYETMRNCAKLCETMRNYAKLCETMPNYAILCQTMKIGRPIPSKCVYLHAPAHRI